MDKTDNTLIQFIRYFFVGGLAFLVDFGVLYLLTKFEFFRKKRYYLFAVTIAFILGLITNYLLSIFWVFNENKVDNKAMEFLIFAVIGVVGLLINALFIVIFTDYIFTKFIKIENKQHRIIISKIISTAVVYFWNFFARKITLF